MRDVIGLRRQLVLVYLDKANGPCSFWPTDYHLDPPTARIESYGPHVIKVLISTDGYMVRIDYLRKLFRDIEGSQRGPIERHPVNMAELHAVISGEFPEQYRDPAYVPDPMEL